MKFSLREIWGIFLLNCAIINLGKCLNNLNFRFPENYHFLNVDNTELKRCKILFSVSDGIAGRLEVNIVNRSCGLFQSGARLLIAAVRKLYYHARTLSIQCVTQQISTETALRNGPWNSQSKEFRICLIKSFFLKKNLAPIWIFRED